MKRQRGTSRTAARTARAPVRIASSARTKWMVVANGLPRTSRPILGNRLGIGQGQQAQSARHDALPEPAGGREADPAIRVVEEVAGPVMRCAASADDPSA